MEVTLQAVNSVKIRGKRTAVSLNPQEATSAYNAAILLGNPAKSSLKIREDAVVIDGPGEYEVAGIKITGTKADDQTVYTISLDNLDILAGSREALEKAHQKLKEHNISLLYTPTTGDASFATALSVNAMIFFGEKAEEVINAFAKDEKKKTAKYQIAAEKLPAEPEAVLLA